MKILITGNNGLLGSEVISIFKRQKLFEAIPFQTKKRDICNIKDCEEALVGVDGIIHLASCQPYKNREDIEYYRVNTNGTIMLREIALKKGILPFLFASSQDVYGDCFNSSNCVTETFQTKPCTSYGKSKLKAEELLVQSESKGLAIFRLAVLVGDYVHKDSFISYIIDAIKGNKRIEIHNRGNRIYNFISVHDAANLFVLALKNKLEGIFNMGSNQKMTTYDVANIIGRLSKREIYYNNNKAERAGFYLNCSKLFRLVDYKCQSSEQTLKNLLIKQGIIK